MQYDVFISYRRDGGAATARILRDRLTEMGYRVFFDVESLRAGYFNTALYSVIEQCKDFVVVLSPNSLDRCVNEDDWVRLEVEHALKKNKNVVPVMLRGFSFPETLPPSIEPLRYRNGIEANEDFFDAFLEKLRTFLLAKPSFWKGLLQNRLLRRMLPVLLSMLVLLVSVLGVRTFLDARSKIYPRTEAEKNLTYETVYYVSRNLTQLDLMAEYYDQALQSARRYLSSGMTDDSDLKERFTYAEMMLKEADVASAAPSDAFLRSLTSSPFNKAEVEAMHENVLLFRDENLKSLAHLKQILQPDAYPQSAVKKLEILDCYQVMLEENLKVFGYAANQMLLPITWEEALKEFKGESLPYLNHIELRAVNWSNDYEALQSAITESLNAIEMAIMDEAAIVGDASRDLEQAEADILQDLVDRGYTRETAEKIWAYQSEDPVQRHDALVKSFLQEGYTQTEAENLADRKEKMLEAQAKIRIGYAALTTDDVNTLWEKLTWLLSVDLYEEALECAQLYQSQMTNSSQYLPAIQLFIHLRQQTDLDFGIMVMEYYEADGVNELLQIGDIIYGFDGKVCPDVASYLSMKEALTTDTYVVDVLRIDGETGEWEQLQLTLTTDMPRVYLNDLTVTE